MAIEVKIPSVGESVQEAVLAEWFKQDGDLVKKDEPIFVIETDKVTLEVAAETNGLLKIIVPEGETVAIGTVVGTIEPAVVSDVEKETPPTEAEQSEAPIGSEEPESLPTPTPASPKPTMPIEVNDTSIPLAPSVRRLSLIHI